MLQALHLCKMGYLPLIAVWGHCSFRVFISFAMLIIYKVPNRVVLVERMHTFDGRTTFYFINFTQY